RERAAERGDVNSSAICARQLQQDGGHVQRGLVREVSLVLAGANPAARIDNVSLKHADGSQEELEDAARIFSGELIHSDEGEAKQESEEKKSEDSEERTVAEDRKSVV